MRKKSRKFRGYRIRGFYCPDFVVELLGKKIVNSSEAIFLSRVHFLSNLKGGCFASNRYFSKVMGISVRSIKRIITKLRTVGLLFVRRVDHKRRLSTIWNDLGRDCLCAAEIEEIKKSVWLYKEQERQRRSMYSLSSREKGYARCVHSALYGNSDSCEEHVSLHTEQDCSVTVDEQPEHAEMFTSVTEDSFSLGGFNKKNFGATCVPSYRVICVPHINNNNIEELGESAVYSHLRMNTRGVAGATPCAPFHLVVLYGGRYSTSENSESEFIQSLCDGIINTLNSINKSKQVDSCDKIILPKANQFFETINCCATTVVSIDENKIDQHESGDHCVVGGIDQCSVDQSSNNQSDVGRFELADCSCEGSFDFGLDDNNGKCVVESQGSFRFGSDDLSDNNLGSFNFYGRESLEMARKKLGRKPPLREKVSTVKDSFKICDVKDSGRVRSRVYSDLDLKLAAKYRSVLMKYDSVALSSISGSVGLGKCAELFYRIRSERGSCYALIDCFLDFFGEHWRDRFVPKVYRVNDIYDYWYRYLDSFRRYLFDSFCDKSELSKMSREEVDEMERNFWEDFRSSPYSRLPMEERWRLFPMLEKGKVYSEEEFRKLKEELRCDRVGRWVDPNSIMGYLTTPRVSYMDSRFDAVLCTSIKVEGWKRFCIGRVRSKLREMMGSKGNDPYWDTWLRVEDVEKVLKEEGLHPGYITLHEVKSYGN